MGLSIDEVQNLLDAGLGVTEISRKKNTHHQTISRLIRRNDLDIYTPFDDPKTLSKVSRHELSKIFYIDSSFKVLADKRALGELSMLGRVCPKELMEVRNSFERDAVSYFVSHVSADECSSSMLRKHRHLENYVYKHYKDLESFREHHNLDSNLIYLNSSRSISLNIVTGLEFESILGNLLESVFGILVEKQKSISDCRPDFVIGDTWIDAKLSKSTALNYGDDTIRKYSEHTDDLIIVYALDDGADVSDVEREYGVTFKHVSEYFENTNEEAIEEINDFIKKASSIRGVQL